MSRHNGLPGYDAWKTSSPDDELGAQDNDQPWADCDCCGKYRPVSRTWAYGTETWACDECLGIEPDEPEHEEEGTLDYFDRHIAGDRK